MQFIKVNDLNICYETKGNGYPLVLINGFSESMDSWDPEMTDALAEKYRVLLFDNRGAGRTETPEEGDFSCEMFADDTAALMESLGIKNANVFGFSMGGVIAQALSLKHPEKVNKLVLGGTFCGGKETVMAAPEVTKILLDTSGGIEGIFSRSLTLLFPEGYAETNPEFTENLKKRFMTAPISSHNARRQLIASMKLSTYSRLPEIKNPALIVTGTEDILIPPQNSRILAERIPGAKLIEYPGAGHYFMAPSRDEFLTDIMEFLDR